MVALFLEGVRDAPRFIAAAEKAARLRKPIVVYKTGLSEVAAEAAASHTGALAGSDRIFDAVCRQFGLVRVDDVADLFPTALTFAWIGDKLPKGRRVGIVSASGGICGVAADECARFGLDIPELSEAAKRDIRAFTPAFRVAAQPGRCHRADPLVSDRVPGHGAPRAGGTHDRRGAAARDDGGRAARFLLWSRDFEAGARGSQARDRGLDRRDLGCAAGLSDAVARTRSPIF